MNNPQNQWSLDRLAKADLTVSFVYGKCGESDPTWSVQVWTDKEEVFDKPFAGTGIWHCLDIAIKECEERGLLSCVKRLHG